MGLKQLNHLGKNQVEESLTYIEAYCIPTVIKVEI